MTTYIELPPQGSPYWGDPVPLVVNLPATDTTGIVRLVTGTSDLYWFNGTSWVLIGSLIDAVANTNSVNLTNTTGTLTADVRLSADAADAGYVLAEMDIQSGASPGLRTQLSEVLIRGLFSGTGLITYTALTGIITLSSATVRAQFSATGPIVYNGTTGDFSIPVATALADGYLSSADWSTFNSKEPAIAPGAITDYYRGDKTFQPLNIEALTAFTDGSSAGAGEINQLLSATQATNTATGVGSTGAWGNAISLSITAGRWLVWGAAGLSENGAVLTTSLSCGISASASGAGISEFDTFDAPFLVSSTSDAILTTPMVPITIGATTTYYLNTRFYYTSGAPQHRGRIQALRIG